MKAPTTRSPTQILRFLSMLVLPLMFVAAGAEVPSNWQKLLPIMTCPDGAHELIAFDNLPDEAKEMLVLIARGGPFRHRQDGVIFKNREKQLPTEPTGFYREYTVITPGKRNRGARRIVVGNKKFHYYTMNHYRSFSCILMNPSSRRK